MKWDGDINGLFKIDSVLEHNMYMSYASARAYAEPCFKKRGGDPNLSWLVLTPHYGYLGYTYRTIHHTPVGPLETHIVATVKKSLTFKTPRSQSSFS